MAVRKDGVGDGETQPGLVAREILRATGLKLERTLVVSSGIRYTTPVKSKVRQNDFPGEISGTGRMADSFEQSLVVTVQLGQS